MDSVAHARDSEIGSRGSVVEWAIRGAFASRESLTEDRLQKRKLGSSELMVTPWALGANVFGWTADEATSFALLDGYVAAGGNFIDTADVYSTWVPGHQGGESEAIIGKWMKARGNRKQLVIATKVGMEMGPGRKGLAP